MYSLKASILFFACSLVAAEIELQFLEYATYSSCEGKDSANLTLISQFTRNGKCSRESNDLASNIKLLSNPSSSRQQNVNNLQVLARSLNPNGAQVNLDVLALVTSGPLEGKYIYEREVVLEPEYLKICSSILGYSYVNSKSNTLLIADKLDLNVLLSPTGAYELFKKGCTTVCKGTAIIVGPTTITQK